jgi:KDO2-lipid IV(A) lauroyltransferase
MNPLPDNPSSLLRFWQPRFWPLWLGAALLRALVWLPYRAQRTAGAWIGRLLYVVLQERRAIAAVNLRLCFPEIDAPGRRRLLRRHFTSLGMGVIDLANAAWATDEQIVSRVRFEGLDNLRAALAAGRGAIVLSGHFSGTEITGRALAAEIPHLAALYRPLHNPLVDVFMRRTRLRAVEALIPKDNMRQLIRSLKQGTAVWYASDQNYRRHYSLLLPFFGEPAMTNGALTHIARLSGAPVVPYLPRRLPDGRYEVRILPALDGFPTGDIAADTRRVTGLIEEHIRGAPEQYYWVHRRFRKRPAPLPDPYRRPA